MSLRKGISLLLLVAFALTSIPANATIAFNSGVTLPSIAQDDGTVANGANKDQVPLTLTIQYNQTTDIEFSGVTATNGNGYSMQVTGNGQLLVENGAVSLATRRVAVLVPPTGTEFVTLSNYVDTTALNGITLDQTTSTLVNVTATTTSTFPVGANGSVAGDGTAIIASILTENASAAEFGTTASASIPAGSLLINFFTNVQSSAQLPSTLGTQSISLNGIALVADGSVDLGDSGDLNITTVSPDVVSSSLNALNVTGGTSIKVADLATNAGKVEFIQAGTATGSETSGTAEDAQPSTILASQANGTVVLSTSATTNGKAIDLETLVIRAAETPSSVLGSAAYYNTAFATSAYAGSDLIDNGNPAGDANGNLLAALSLGSSNFPNTNAPISLAFAITDAEGNASTATLTVNGVDLVLGKNGLVSNAASVLGDFDNTSNEGGFLGNNGLTINGLAAFYDVESGAANGYSLVSRSNGDAEFVVSLHSNGTGTATIARYTNGGVLSIDATNASVDTVNGVQNGVLAAAQLASNTLTVVPVSAPFSLGREFIAFRPDLVISGIDATVQQAGIKVTVTATGGNLPTGGTTLEIANMIPAGGIDANEFAIQANAILADGTTVANGDLVQADANGTRSNVTLSGYVAGLSANGSLVNAGDFYCGVNGDQPIARSIVITEADNGAFSTLEDLSGLQLQVVLPTGVTVMNGSSIAAADNGGSQLAVVATNGNGSILVAVPASTSNTNRDALAIEFRNDALNLPASQSDFTATVQTVIGTDTSVLGTVELGSACGTFATVAYCDTYTSNTGNGSVTVAPPSSIAAVLNGGDTIATTPGFDLCLTEGSVDAFSAFATAAIAVNVYTNNGETVNSFALTSNDSTLQTFRVNGATAQVNGLLATNDFTIEATVGGNRVGANGSIANALTAITDSAAIKTLGADVNGSDLSILVTEGAFDGSTDTLVKISSKSGTLEAGTIITASTVGDTVYAPVLDDGSFVLEIRVQDGNNISLTQTPTSTTSSAIAPQAVIVEPTNANVAPALVSAAVSNISALGNITARGKAPVVFTVTASGLFNGAEFVPTASQLTLGGQPVTAVAGSDNQFISVVKFKNSGALTLSALVNGQTITTTLGGLNTDNPNLSGRPRALRVVETKTGRVRVNGLRLKNAGVFGFILDDGSYQAVDLRKPRRGQTRQASVANSDETIPTNAVYGVYHVPGRGIDVTDNFKLRN